jgi:hypothetical protein
MTTKAERVAQCNIDVTLLRLVEGHIQFRIKIRIVFKVIDGRRDD